MRPACGLRRREVAKCDGGGLGGSGSLVKGTVSFRVGARGREGLGECRRRGRRGGFGGVNGLCGRRPALPICGRRRRGSRIRVCCDAVQAMMTFNGEHPEGRPEREAIVGRALYPSER